MTDTLSCVEICNFSWISGVSVWTVSTKVTTRDTATFVLNHHSNVGPLVQPNAERGLGASDSYIYRIRSSRHPGLLQEPRGGRSVSIQNFFFCVFCVLVQSKPTVSFTSSILLYILVQF